MLCAGVLGELALDDAYCAGRIAEALGGDATDSATAAIRLAELRRRARGDRVGTQRVEPPATTASRRTSTGARARTSLDVVPRYRGTVGPAAEVGV